MNDRLLKKIILEELRKVLKEKSFEDDEEPRDEDGNLIGDAPDVRVPPSSTQRNRPKPKSGEDPSISLGKKPKRVGSPIITIIPYLINASKITSRDNIVQGLGLKKGSLSARFHDCGDDLSKVKVGCRGVGVLKLQAVLKTAQDALNKKGVQITSPEIDAVFGPQTQKAYSEVMARFPDLFIPKARGSSEIIKCQKNPASGMCTIVYFRELQKELENTGADFNYNQYMTQLEDNIKTVLPDLKLLVNPGCVADANGRVKCTAGSKFVNPYDTNP